MVASTPDSKKLLRYRPFLDEIQKVRGVDKEALAYICATIPGLEQFKAHYERLRQILSNARERWPSPSTVAASNVPKRFVTASKEDFRGEIWEKCVRASDGLYLTGKAGTGKTHLAVALLKEDAQREPEVYYSHKYNDFRMDLPPRPKFVSVPMLLLQIRESFRREGEGVTEGDIIGDLTGKDLVVFDDLGAEKTSEWSIQTLYTIIDTRYREMRRTIITSNLSLDEISEKVGDRIASRIAGMCSILTLSGRDRRVGKP